MTHPTLGRVTVMQIDVAVRAIVAAGDRAEHTDVAGTMTGGHVEALPPEVNERLDSRRVFAIREGGGRPRPSIFRCRGQGRRWDASWALASPGHRRYSPPIETSRGFR